MVGRLVSSKHLFRAVIRHDTQINETRRLVALMCARACVWSYCRWRTTLRNCVLCGPLTGADARSDLTLFITARPTMQTVVHLLSLFTASVASVSLVQ